MPRERVGYVLKVYPRFSETFVVTELLAVQDLGVELEVFSLRPPADGRFHSSLARLRAPVTYLAHAGHTKTPEVWATLRQAHPLLPDLGAHLPALLAVEARDAVQAVELAAAVRRRGITHLHAHFASVAATVAGLAARLAGVSWSMTAHAKDVFHDDVDPADLGAKLADARTTITISRYNLEHLQREFGSRADRVRLVCNGLDLDAFPYRAPVGRPPAVAAVGRLVEKKGFADLLDAVSLLRARGRDVELDLVGTGALAEPLAARVADLGLGDRVRMHGALTQDEVVEVVQRAAVFAAPCVVGSDGNRDGLPTVLLEAMALGTPVVATPVTGIPEAVVDGETGRLVPEGDPERLAAAIEALLADPREAARLAAAARALVERDFDARVQARLVAQAFAVDQPAEQGAA